MAGAGQGTAFFCGGQRPGDDPGVFERGAGMGRRGSADVRRRQLYGQSGDRGHRAAWDTGRGAGRAGQRDTEPDESEAVGYCQQGQVGVFVPHESRDQDSHERDHRHDCHCPSEGSDPGAGHGLFA